MDHSILEATLTSAINAPAADVTAAAAIDPDISEQLAAEQVRSAKLGVLIAALEMLSVEHLKMSEPSVQQFEATLAELSYQEFVLLPAKKGSGVTTLLGIDNTPSARHQFTYTEKKAICAATLELAARRIVQPAIDFMRERKRREQSSAAFSTFQLERTQVELLVAEKARQQLQTNLMDAELARLELLQRAVNLRHSASMAAEMDLLFRRLQLSCEKVGLLKAMVEREFVNRSDHAGKALEQMENFLDDALDAIRPRTSSRTSSK